MLNLLLAIGGKHKDRREKKQHENEPDMGKQRKLLFLAALLALLGLGPIGYFKWFVLFSHARICRINRAIKSDNVNRLEISRLNPQLSKIETGFV